MEPSDHAEHIRSLHELVTGTAEITRILEGVTTFAATAISRAAGTGVECALTLRRRKRTATVAGSSPQAVELDVIEQRVGHGPCLDALDAGRPMLLADVDSDVTWPEYSRALAAEGIRTALGVPMELGESSEAVLNFFAPETGVFTDEVINAAAGFADVAGSTLRLAIRIETVEHLNTDLKAAMASRTVIDQACGIIMAQNRCGPEEAFEFLRKASSHRNEKLNAVAESIVAHLRGRNDQTLQFED